MLHSIILRIAVAIVLVMSSQYLFGDTFIVGWLTYIAYDIINTILKAWLREDTDESK